MWTNRIVEAVMVLVLLTTRTALAKLVKPKDSNVIPHFTHQHLNNFTTRVGNEISFDCSVENIGSYKVAWLHSEKGILAVHPHVIIQNERISVSSDQRITYRLKLRDIRETDAGVYICQINTGAVISISGTLSVVVPPDIIDEESNSDTLTTEGKPVSLTCRAKGNPPPTIVWRREDGKNIRLCHNDMRTGNDRSNRDCREVPVHYGSELALPYVSRFDSGIYLCIASNGVQPSVSKVVRLYVDFPPTLWISHQLIGSEVGGSAQLECLTAAHPPSLNFWSRDGGKSYILAREGKYEFTTVSGDPSFYNIQMKLKIQNVTENDFGKYYCLAKNSQGETQGEIALYEVEKPSTLSTAVFSDYDLRTQESEFDTFHNQTSVVLLDVPKDGQDREDRNKSKNKNGRKKNQRKKDENEYETRKEKSNNYFQPNIMSFGNRPASLPLSSLASAGIYLFKRRLVEL